MTAVKFTDKLGLGGAALGNMYASVDDPDAEATLAAAWSVGIRHFDTAPIYGRGLSEHRFGHALRNFPRESYVFSTKVGRLTKANHDTLTDPGPSDGDSASETALFKAALPFDIEVDYGYDATIRSVEDSLQRLGLPYLDIAYVHDLGPDHLGEAWHEEFDRAIGGAFKALSELRDQGIIKAWGLGNNVIEPLVRALEETAPDIIQVSGRYTLLDQTALADLLPLSMKCGVPVVLGGNYNSDILAGGYRFNYRSASQAILERRDRIAAICERHGVNIRAAALQFGAAHPAIVSIIPGARSVTEIYENAKYFRQVTPMTLWEDLKGEGIIGADAPIPQSY